VQDIAGKVTRRRTRGEWSGNVLTDLVVFGPTGCAVRRVRRAGGHESTSNPRGFSSGVSATPGIASAILLQSLATLGH